MRLRLGRDDFFAAVFWSRSITFYENYIDTFPPDGKIKAKGSGEMEQNSQDIPAFKLVAEIIVKILLVIAIPATLILGAAWVIDLRYERIAEARIDAIASEYISLQYPGNDFNISKARHDFLDNCYRVHIQSRSSQDTRFYVDIDDQDYSVTDDTYETFVLSGANTRNRIAEDYDTLVKDALSSMPGCFNVSAGFCRYAEEFTSKDFSFSPNGLNSSDLLLDGKYDAALMGESYGSVTVQFMVPEEHVHIQEALETLLETDRILTEKGIGYYVMKVTIANGIYPENTVELNIYGITKEDLTCDDPLGRLQEIWEEQEARRRAGQE